MMVISGMATLAVVCVLAALMLSDGVGAGRYKDPNVAESVMRGTIYDRGGRALAMEVPQYGLYAKSGSGDWQKLSQVLSMHLDLTPDEILLRMENSASDRFLIASGLTAEKAASIETDAQRHGVRQMIEASKEYVRRYPGAFHASQLVDETERVFDKLLSPAPGYNESTTYGYDVHLTIDLDIQYLLDLAVQQVYELQKPDYAVAFLMDSVTKDVLACTTYPFYDLNSTGDIPESQRVPRALLSSMGMNLIAKVTEHGSQSPITDYRTDGAYTYDIPAVMELANANDGHTALMQTIPDEKPRYIVLFASVNPRYYQVSSVLPYAISSLEEGLYSQNKL